MTRTGMIVLTFLLGAGLGDSVQGAAGDVETGWVANMNFTSPASAGGITYIAERSIAAAL